MPNRAKYLSVADVKKIISLRGKESPTKIAKQYKIGLARLYKIWTDASNDKKFPGGFAGTVSGKHLTESITKINQEIKTRQTEYAKLMQQFHEYRDEIKKKAELIVSDEKVISSLWGKVLQYRKRKREITEMLTEYKKEEDEYNNAVKNLEPLKTNTQGLQKEIEKQNEMIQKLQKIVNDNNETINSLKKIRNLSIFDLYKDSESLSLDDVLDKSRPKNQGDKVEIKEEINKETKFDSNWNPQFPE
ncbi:hypothetical protein ACJMK2_021291 [Sinanodonta woodiana]|uniref:HTH psq-type domain-containing protein n=1 Tax=Sinanodonta woodiana TaxID=1069815 RepID=A0ABD3TFM8_SINWO